MIVGVYFHHLFALAQAVRDGCDQVFADAPISPTDGYIKVDPALHARIDGVLIDAANLKKLIRPRPSVPRVSRSAHSAFDVCVPKPLRSSWLACR
jgi:hypothetical protein